MDDIALGYTLQRIRENSHIQSSEFGKDFDFDSFKRRKPQVFSDAARVLVDTMLKSASAQKAFVKALPSVIRSSGSTAYRGEKELYEDYKREEEVQPDLSQVGFFVDTAGGENQNADNDTSEPELNSNKMVETKRSKPGRRSLLSTFVPSLEEGYVSGSDASDDVDAQFEETGLKKGFYQRKGQRARRAEWESRYGKDANHLRNGQGPAPRHQAGRGNSRISKSTPAPSRSANFTPMATSRARLEGGSKGVNNKQLALTDPGKLHPSWAAKRALTEKEKGIVAFKGTKVTFT